MLIIDIEEDFYSGAVMQDGTVSQWASLWLHTTRGVSSVPGLAPAICAVCRSSLGALVFLPCAKHMWFL